MEKIRLKRHESFALREGWLEKGLNLINPDNPGEAFKDVKGIRELGIGANMVKSLRYWMEACNLLTHYHPGRPIEFTDFAKVLLKYDRYLEKEYSWWILHYYLATNRGDAPIIYYMFNVFSSKNINLVSIEEDIYQYFSSYGEFNPKFISSDLSIFRHTYALDEQKRDPEENIISPFSKLKLLEKRIGKEEGYTFLSSEYRSFLSILIYHFLFIHYSKEEENETQISFDINDAYEYIGSPAKIFNIEKGMFNQYLVELKNLNLITLNKTAGLNVAYFNENPAIPLESVEDIYRYLEDK